MFIYFLKQHKHYIVTLQVRMRIDTHHIHGHQSHARTHLTHCINTQLTLCLYNINIIYTIVIINVRRSRDCIFYLIMCVYVSVAYPELVSRGVSKSRKFKWLVKVGACKDVNPLIKKNHGRGGGGFPGNQKKNLDTPLCMSATHFIYFRAAVTLRT